MSSAIAIAALVASLMTAVVGLTTVALNTIRIREHLELQDRVLHGQDKELAKQSRALGIKPEDEELEEQ